MDADQTPAFENPVTTRGHWLRRAAMALAALLGLWFLAWLGMPPLLKWQIQTRTSAAIGRAVTVERVDFRPWSLELEITDLRVADATGSGEQFSVARLYMDVELQSLLRLAPVVDALTVEHPHLRLRHLGQGHYDVDDVLRRLRELQSEPAPEAARFALFNVALSDGEVELLDDPVAAKHQLRGLVLQVPFLSNLDSRRDVLTKPRLAFVLNGSTFDSSAVGTPFAQTRQTDVQFNVPALDLAPYLPYWPAQWPIRPQAGVLRLALKLAFEQREAPRVAVSGDASLSGVRLLQVLPGTAGAELLAFERLGVKIARLEPLAQRVDLESVEWQAPSLSLARDAAGQLNLERIAAGFAASGSMRPAAPAAATQARSPWQVSVGQVSLTRGTVRWDDAAVKPQARLALEDLQGTLSDLSWPVQGPVPFDASARLGSTTLRVQGSATHAVAQAQVSMGELPLSVATPYMNEVLEPTLAGRLAAEWVLDWRAATGEQPMALVLRAPRLELKDLVLGPVKRPLASWKSLLVEGADVDLAARSATLDKLVLSHPRLQLERDAQGRWAAQRWIKSVSQPMAPARPGWRVALNDVQLSDGAVQLLDRQPAEPVALALSAIQLRLKNLRPLDAVQVAMPVSLAARVAQAGDDPGEPGRLDFAGALRLPSPQPKASDGLLARGKLQAERLPVHTLEPYLGDQLNLELLHADASYRGTLDAAQSANGLALALAGDLALEDVRANSLSPSEELLAWKSLNLRGLKLALAPGQAPQLVVGETVLSDYFARVIVSETGRINLQDLVKGAGDAAASEGLTMAKAGASATTVAPAAGSPSLASAPQADIRFGPTSLVNGKVFFSDRFVQPNYSANLSELSGGLSAFSNANATAVGPPQLADLALRGRAEGTASLEIVGKLNPLAKPLALDIQGKVRDLELPPLSPYTSKYAGYGINRGKLSVDVAYRIAPDGQLTASNQITLNQLVFGDRVEGSGAPNLPVKLAVALLADRDGVISINLPVSGSLKDPQFQIAPIIIKLILNLIGKAVTAPFSLLAGALGGGGDQLSQVVFAPGGVALSDESKKRLDTVAKALADRPALQLTVIGHSDLEAERSAFRRTRLDAQVLAEKRRALARSGATITGTLLVTPEEYPALLKEVYKRADITKPRNLVGMAKDIPLPDMEALLLAAIPVGADAMRGLAVARGVAVKDYLASRELPEDRMFLGAPKLAREGDTWRPQAELKLAPR